MTAAQRPQAAEPPAPSGAAGVQARSAAAAARSAAAPARPGPAPARRPPLRIVGPRELGPRARRRRARALTTAIGALVSALLFGLVVFHVLIAQSQLQLGRLETRALDAQARYDRLRLQVAQLSSPGRIVASAQERLGMVPPPGITYLSPVGPANPVSRPAALTPAASSAQAPPASPAPQPTPSTTAPPRPTTPTTAAPRTTPTTSARRSTTPTTASPRPRPRP
ncbi:MAG TPA: hypothetical protein VKI20_00565 [Acidimicrobiales bacterium]|nr:hypothetical protein [Acidimicrobiales bacterium]